MKTSHKKFPATESRMIQPVCRVMSGQLGLEVESARDGTIEIANIRGVGTIQISQG